MLKVMTIVGTRPEIIRLSRLIPLLDVHTQHVLVHTGQNKDYELNEVFFEQMGVRAPDHFMGVFGGSLGQTLGQILEKTEQLLDLEKPEAVLILGDTNSSLGAIIARRKKIPVYHMEAGNRSFDRNVPEETNRKIVDHMADFNMVYTEHARRNLIAEGFPPRRIYLTGSPMREVITHYRAAIEASDVLSRLSLEPRRYFVVSLHREENVDNSVRLRSLLHTLQTVRELYGFPIVVATHPRTRKRLESLGEPALSVGLSFLKPFGFFDYNALQQNAFCTISDSGTISEEAAILGFPAITPRDAIERPEAIDAGCIVATGLDEDTILASIKLATEFFQTQKDQAQVPSIPAEYSVENTSERVLKLLLGTARLSNGWDGIRLNDL